jgi:uncharacterized Zn finger protein (UPF0148 family)
MLLVTSVSCPNCGAPLGLRDGQRHVLCGYCNSSLAVGAAPAGAAAASAPAPVQLTSDRIAKEDIERVKQLVLDGKRDEAIAHYQRIASVPRQEAEAAVDQLALSSVWKLSRRAPINAFGFALFLGMIGLGVGLAAWGASEVMESPGFALLVLFGVLLAGWHFVRLIPKAISSAVAAFGAEGRGRVIKCAALRPMGDKGMMLLVMFEVQPAGGDAPFVDEEVIAVRTESVAKLEPGNIVPVRFDGARTRVFPVSPITVVGRAGGGYRA